MSRKRRWILWGIASLWGMTVANAAPGEVFRKTTTTETVTTTTTTVVEVVRPEEVRASLKINTGAGVYLRNAPFREAKKRYLLHFGAVVQAKEQLALAEETWCRVVTSEGQDGWIPSSFLVDYQQNQALPIALKIAQRKLESTNQFGDLVEVGNFLVGLEIHQGDHQDLVTRANRLTLSAWQKTYAAIPPDQKEASPYREWLEEQAERLGWNNLLR